MDDKFNYVTMKAGRRSRTAMLCFSFALSFALTGLRSSAQEMEVLVRDIKTPIFKLYDTGKNETAIVAGIGTSENVRTLYTQRWPETQPLTRRDIILWDAQYRYAGKIPARPQSVSFTFYINEGKDKYGENKRFSVISDGTAVQEGDFVLEDRTFEDGKKPTIQKVLTVTVPVDVFLSIVRARKLHIKFGPETYKLNGDQLKHIQALAKTIEKLSK